MWTFNLAMSTKSSREIAWDGRMTRLQMQISWTSMPPSSAPWLNKHSSFESPTYHHLGDANPQVRSHMKCTVQQTTWCDSPSAPSTKERLYLWVRVLVYMEPAGLYGTNLRHREVRLAGTWLRWMIELEKGWSFCWQVFCSWSSSGAWCGRAAGGTWFGCWPSDCKLVYRWRYSQCSNTSRSRPLFPSAFLHLLAWAKDYPDVK